MRAGCYITDRVDPQSGLVAPVAELVRDMEVAGFDAAWTFDSLGRFPILDSLMALTVAAATTSLDVGTGVLQLPLRHPIELANRILTLQQIAQDRLTLGVGAGSTRHDYEMVGGDFETRFFDLSRALEIFDRLWKGEEIDGMALPLWPGTTELPPIIIGSWGSDRWIHRAATEYAGWMVSLRYGGFSSAEQGIARFARYGTGGRAIAASLLFDLRKTPSASSPDPRKLDYSEHLGLVDVTTALRALADLGFDEIIIRCATTDLEELATAAELIATTKR